MTDIDWQLLGPAALAGFLVVLTHAPLGQEVLRRGIIFLDLAIAQIAALGALAALSVGAVPHSLTVQVSSFGAALAGALFLHWTERRWAEVQEAIIGILFVLSATAALLLLAGSAHGSEAMQDILAGQILWVSYDQLWYGGVVYALLLPLLLTRWLSRPLVFYAVFSLCVTLSVQWVGVYLVFSTLVIPALATLGWKPRWRLPHAYVIGVLGYLLGLIASTQADWPTGPLIVWSLLGVAIVFRLTFGRHMIHRCSPVGS